MSECKSTGHALTQTVVAVSLTDGRSEPSVSNKFKMRMCSGLERGKIIMDLGSTLAQRGTLPRHVRECADPCLANRPSMDDCLVL